MVDPGLSAQQNATNMLNNKYGPGNWKPGPGSEFSRIVKWLIRSGILGLVSSWLNTDNGHIVEEY